MSAHEVTSRTGTVVNDSHIQHFQTALRGQLLRPDHAGYDDARRVWNGMVDKRPALIAQCTGAADVVDCVRFAREHDLLVAVRGGGHNYAGTSVCDGGLLIDLSPMKGIRVEPARRRAHAQPGLRLGEFDRETQAFGLATTLGINTDTGIAGLTLGGGYGWLAGLYGLACDNLESVDVVTADGQLVTASEREHPDLFWGLRGGSGNFGVVTSFEYQLHPVGPVLGGMVLYPMSQGKEFLRFHLDFASGAPDEVSTVALLLNTPDGTPAVGTAACYVGPPERGEAALKPLRTFDTPLADLIEPKSYCHMQMLFDDSWPAGRRYYHKSSNFRDLTDQGLDMLLSYGRSLPTPLSILYFMHCHGAATRVGPDHSAFPHRYAHHPFGIHPATDDPADDETIRQWARTCWQDMRPFVDRAVYVNALEEDEGEARLREAYGTNFDRLRELKQKYDPTNLFRLNQNLAVPAK